jgi:glycosyltransferase involved in cell wall biosynthesis
MAVPVSVVVPAHDEASVIARGLRALVQDAEPGEIELVIVCNGCRDRTAAVAHAAAPDAILVEIDVASKAAALNEGDARASRFPRFYVDADVELSTTALRETVAALEDGALCAAPRPAFDLDGAPWYTRSFFAVLERMPFLSDPGVVGTGVYAVSVDGRRRFGRFPALTADDQFVMDRFVTGERRAVEGARFVVHPPRSWRDLVRVRTRVYRGRRELHAVTAPVEVVAAHNGSALVSLLLDPTTAPHVPVYVAVNVAARILARRRWSGTWERDASTRTVAGSASAFDVT